VISRPSNLNMIGADEERVEEIFIRPFQASDPLSNIYYGAF
jgi:hypothetical protein